MDFTPSENVCVSIQLFILTKCAPASSFGFPENSGLKCDQFNCSTCCIGCAGMDRLTWNYRQLYRLYRCLQCLWGLRSWARPPRGTCSAGDSVYAMVIYVMLSVLAKVLYAYILPFSTVLLRFSLICKRSYKLNLKVYQDLPC